MSLMSITTIASSTPSKWRDVKENLETPPQIYLRHTTEVTSKETILYVEIGTNDILNTTMVSKYFMFITEYWSTTINTVAGTVAYSILTCNRFYLRDFIT